MRKHTFHCPGPVRRETLLLGSWVSRVLPSGSRCLAIEEAEILWVRDDGAKLAYFWDGKWFKDALSFCSHARALRSVEYGVEEAREIVTRLGLTTTDRLELRVTAEVFEIPAMLSSSQFFSLSTSHVRSYQELRDLYVGTREELERVAAWRQPVDWDPNAWHPGLLLLARRTLADEVVWSSRQAETENVAALEAFLARFTAGSEDGR